MNNNQLTDWHRIAPGYYERQERGYTAVVSTRGGFWHWRVQDSYYSRKALGRGSEATSEAAVAAALEVLRGDKR